MQEIWKDIKGYEGLYQVSNLGNVYSIKNNKLLKLHISHKGYVVVCLYKNNKLSWYHYESFDKTPVLFSVPFERLQGCRPGKLQ